MAETYTADQLKVIRTIKREARKRYADDPSKRRRRELTAYTIGRVETNFQNLKGGDKDSVNWRQERASNPNYAGDMSITRSVNRVFDEMDQHDRGQDIGELAADVQRPAAQYRSRYGQHLDEARTLAGSTKPGRSTSRGTPGKVERGTPPKLAPATTTTDKRAALVDALLEPGDGGVLKRWQTRLRSGEYTTSTPAKVTPGKPAKVVPGKPAKTSAAPTSGGSGTIRELFWNGPGAVNIKEGKRQPKGFVDGHTEHVHLAADRATMKRAEKLAKSLGLHVGEYGRGITSGHAPNSHHYEPFGAMDVSGTRMAEFARRVARGDF